MNLLKLLASDGFLVVNKTLIAKLGLYEAIILAELISEYNYWESKQQLEDGYFYSTLENIERNTHITLHHQRIAFKHLEELQIISKVKKGLPAKRYLKINEEKVVECILAHNTNHKCNCSNTSSGNTVLPLESMYYYGNNNNINNNKIKNNKNINTSHLRSTYGEGSSSLDNSSKDTTLRENYKKELIGSPTTSVVEKSINIAAATTDNQLNYTPPTPRQVDKILSQKLSQVNETETKINKLKKEQKEATKLSVKEQVDKRNKKARLKEAKKVIDNEEVMKVLDEFLDYYQFTFNIMSPQTWNKMLHELTSFSSEPSVLIKSVNNSITHSWRSFYNPLTKRTNDKEPSYMIQKTTFYPEDKIHETIDRAQNSDGTIITF